MHLYPIGKSILVQVKKPEDKKGIILMNKLKDEPIQVVVIRKGDKTEIPVSEGDIVMIPPFAGMNVKGGTEEEPYLILDDQSVIGVLR